MFLGGTVRFYAFLGLFLLLLTTINGMAEETSKGDAPAKEAEVSQRAVERWGAIIAGNFRSAFDFLSPGMRKIVPFEYYRSKAGGAVTDWVKARVESVDCQLDVCALAVRVTFVYRGGLDQMKDQTSSSLIQEKWLFSDGEWWLVPDKL